MSELDAISLSRAMLLTALAVGAPVLLAVAGVGLGVSLLQALTQVQEQSLSFVPKLAAGVGALLALGPWMLQTTVDLLVRVLAGLAGGGP